MPDFEHLICGDYGIVICKFLNPKDILTLCNMYPMILSKITNIYKKRVGEEIDGFFRRVFGDSYLEFRKEMVSANAILSGSLIIQTILGQRWAGHRFNRLDVDIFLRVDPIYTDDYHLNEDYTFYNHDYKFKLGYTGLHRFLHKTKDENNGFSRYVTHSQYRDALGENVILRINDYVIQNENIFQIVELNSAKHTNYQEFIIGSVDFNICKNFFRYTNSEDTIDDFEIVIENINAIIERKAKFNFVHDLKSSKERREKYINRGFTFV